jgi:hypothetical protein
MTIAFHPPWVGEAPQAPGMTRLAFGMISVMSQPPSPPPVPPPWPPQQQPHQAVLPYHAGPACPKCGGSHATPVTFTWWGGLVGPRLLNHVRCTSCRYAYNGKTGRPNTAGIAVYTLVGFAIAAVVFYFLVLG